MASAWWAANAWPSSHESHSLVTTSATSRGRACTRSGMAVPGPSDEAEERRLNEELDSRARPRKLWFIYQCVVTCLVAAVVCYVAVTRLSDGQDATMWFAILIGLPLIMVALGLFLRWGIKNHRL
jgi:protein-S-isoprenylcysteine O-methyltransferase Ste14